MNKILIIGDIKVGKTSLINKISNNNFDDKYFRTIGCNVSTLNYKNKKLYITELPGDKKTSIILDHTFKNINIVILMFDLSNIMTFINITEWLSLLNFDKLNIFLVGNKCDKTIEISDKIICDFIQNNESNHEFKYIKISVKNNININYLFDLIINYL